MKRGITEKINTKSFWMDHQICASFDVISNHILLFMSYILNVCSIFNAVPLAKKVNLKRPVMDLMDLIWIKDVSEDHVMV